MGFWATPAFTVKLDSKIGVSRQRGELVACQRSLLARSVEPCGSDSETFIFRSKKTNREGRNEGGSASDGDFFFYACEDFSSSFGLTCRVISLSRYEGVGVDETTPWVFVTL